MITEKYKNDSMRDLNTQKQRLSSDKSKYRHDDSEAVTPQIDNYIKDLEVTSYI